MATKVLIPCNMDVPVGEAVKVVQDQLPADHEVCFTSVITPDTPSSVRSRARSSLIRRLMVFRTRGVTSEMQLVEADTEAAGLADAAAKFGASEILIVSGTGDADRTGLIDELKSATGLPVNVAVISGLEAPAG